MTAALNALKPALYTVPTRGALRRLRVSPTEEVELRPRKVRPLDGEGDSGAFALRDVDEGALDIGFVDRVHGLRTFGRRDVDSSAGGGYRGRTWRRGVRTRDASDDDFDRPGHAIHGIGRGERRFRGHSLCWICSKVWWGRISSTESMGGPKASYEHRALHV